MIWVRVAAFLAVAGLFVADFGFGAMAKEPPIWAYAVPGLLALGIEIKALQRLIIEALRALARVPSEQKEEDQ